MPEQTQEELLTRAGGNPLYAEQYVRMLAERGDADPLPLPETVQGIIAARLDGLPDDEKSLLQTAAVFGKVFWLGAVAQVGSLDRRKVELQLHALERKDFMQRARRSSVANEAEYAFLHLVVRDVAYGQIPRGRRAEQHRLAAEWLSALGRAADNAEMLAHHYNSAMELRRLSGQPLDIALAGSAVGALQAAGDRAAALGAYATAAGYFQSAVELATPDSPERARLLFHHGRARFVAGDTNPELLAAACAALEAGGEQEAAAEAEACLAELHWTRGDHDRAFEHVNRARTMVEAYEPSRIQAYVISSVSRYLMLSKKNDEAIRLGREALRIAEQLGLDDVRADALQNVGVARVDSGDMGGVDDLEQSIGIARAAVAPAVLSRAQVNLSATLWELGKLSDGMALLQKAGETAFRFGLVSDARWCRVDLADCRFQVGRWEECLSVVDEFLAEVEAGLPQYPSARCYCARAQIRLGRDDVAGALTDAEQALDCARVGKDPQLLYFSMAQCGDVFREAGNHHRASLLLNEFLAALRTGKGLGPDVEGLAVVARTLSAVGREHELLDILPGVDSLWVNVAAACARGNLAAAAEICDHMGARTEEARIRLLLSESLVRQNQWPEADVQLQGALNFYRAVGAIRYIRQAERLLDACARGATAKQTPSSGEHEPDDTESACLKMAGDEPLPQQPPREGGDKREHTSGHAKT